MDNLIAFWAGTPEWVKEQGGKVGWYIAGLVSVAAWESRMRLINFAACSTVFALKRIRLSASGLVRIQVDDKYLLVRGSRIKTQFQPIGGVFKYYPDGKARLEEFRFQYDSNIKVDKDSRNDLRINVPGWKFPSLMRWFDSERGRECDPWREFHEELVAPGILPEAIFRYAQFRYLKRHESRLHWSEHFHVWEVLVADIFELQPTPEQEKELRRLMTTRSDRYIWISSEVIRRRGVEPGKETKHTVSLTATWLL